MSLIYFPLRTRSVRPSQAFVARPGWAAVVLFLAALVVFAAPGRAQERIQLVGSQGSGIVDVWLTTSDRTVQNGLSSGTGVIHWTIGGKASVFGLDFEAPVPYKELEVSGTAPALKATGGKYTLTSDAKAKNILKTGLDLTVKKNAVIEGSVVAGKRHLKFTGNAELKVGSKSGNLGTLQRLEIDEDGGVYLEGTAHLTEVPLLVATVVDANVHFKFDRPASGPGSDSFKALTAKIAADLPDVLSSDAKPLLLSVKNLSLDRDGNLTFEDGKTLAGSTALRIPLVRPAGFALLVTSVSDFDVATGTVTKVELKSDLCLPPKFKDAQGGEAVIKNIDFKYDTNGLILTVDRPAADLDIRWDNFKLVVPKGQGAATAPWGAVVLDLDPLKPNTPAIANPAGGGNLPPAWTGFYLKEATLHLPDSLKGSGAPAIAVQNFMLDANGLSGSVAITDPARLSNLKIPGFAASTGKVKSLKLGFVHTRLSEFAAKGTLKLEAFDATIDASVALSDSGAASVALDPSEDVEIQSLGLLLSIDKGSVAISASGKATVDITGSIKVPENAEGLMNQIAGTQVSFAGLKLDDKGAFSSGSVFLDVPSPVTIDMGPARASISQIGFGQHYDNDPNTKDPWVKLTGDVAVEGLPTSGGIGFEGLTIYKREGMAPGFAFGGIQLDIAVEKVGRLGVALVSRDYPEDTDKVPKVWKDYLAANSGKKVRVLHGRGDMALDCFGDPGPEIAVEFLAAKTGWFGKLNMQLDASKALQLGSTPFKLYGFQGGMGFNVISATDGAKGVPGVDYDLVPMPPGSSEKLWLFTGGVRVGTQDGYLIWGDMVLTAQFGAAFWIDLDTKLYLLTDGIGISAPPTNPSKYIHGNLHYDGPAKEFTAAVTGEFYFPDRTNPKLTILGSTSVIINPALREIRIGKDVVDVPGSSPKFTDPVLIKFGAVTGQGALVLTNDASTVKFRTGAALTAKFGFDEVTVLKVIKVSGSGQLAAFVYLEANLAKQNGKWKFDGATGHMGLSAAITLSLEAGKLGDATVTAGVDADLSATLNDSGFSASGSVKIYAEAFKKQISFEPQFTYQGQ